MKVQVNVQNKIAPYQDPTCWQNSTLRYVPPVDFPAFLTTRLGRAKIMRVWITLDEYWDHRTGITYPDYEIGQSRYPVETLHYPYDWASIVPAPSGTRFEGYLTSHSRCADELLLNVRRFEREVSDGVITYDQYEDVFSRAVEHCKALAPNIRYIECCNEVDIATFGKLTAEEYVKIYLRAHRAIRKLNEKHQYPIPLEIGGYSAAHPLRSWQLMSDVMDLLKASEIGGDPMDFYSYHMYNVPETRTLILGGQEDVSQLGGVEMIQRIYDLHNAMLARLQLPAKPVFLNELGKARATGVDGDSLFNASSLITYLIAFSCGKFPGMDPFPWCTFHNPNLQISYTQYLYQADGSYVATPNGIAVEMLHGLLGDRLESTVTEAFGPDMPYRAIAVSNDTEICVLCTNPTGETVPCSVDVDGLANGQYTVSVYHCNHTANNCVTGNGNGRLTQSAQEECLVTGGKLRFTTPLDKHCFMLLRIPRK